jgi:hypothetical protein
MTKATHCGYAAASGLDAALLARFEDLTLADLRKVVSLIARRRAPVPRGRDAGYD